MVVEILIICFLAKIKNYKLKYLFDSWTFYPVLAVQCILIFFNFSVFFGTYYFVQFASSIDFAIILSFIFSMYVYKLYKPAISGSVLVVIGTFLNKFAITQNGGKMPAFPTFSYITGYVTPNMFGAADNLHVLGNSATKFIFLTDYIDYGYSILSVGDVFIHLFFCIMLYSIIKAVNIHHCDSQEKETRAN